MKYFALILITLFIFKAYADENSSIVLNHLMTIGRNDQGFEKLPEKLKLGEWIFESFPPNYYYVTGPEGVAKRKYEYTFSKGKIQSIAMTGGHTQRILYTKDACVEVYKASLGIKAEESLLDTTLNEIFAKYKVQGPINETNDKWYARNYAKNCKLIFGLNQEQTLKQMTTKSKTNN